MSEHGEPPPHTGQGEVDAVLRELVDVFERPAEDQVAAIDDAHARLRAALDSATGGGHPAAPAR